MKGSSSLIFIGLASALLLAYAYSKGPNAGGSQTPGKAATGGGAQAGGNVVKPVKPIDPIKAITETARAEAAKAGQQVVTNWFTSWANS